MSAVGFECKCCGEESNPVCGDSTFGDVCVECATGINNGREILKKLKVAGIYSGPCADNGEGGFQ